MCEISYAGAKHGPLCLQSNGSFYIPSYLNYKRKQLLTSKQNKQGQNGKTKLRLSDFEVRILQSRFIYPKL